MTALLLSLILLIWVRNSYIIIHQLTLQYDHPFGSKPNYSKQYEKQVEIDFSWDKYRLGDMKKYQSTQMEAGN